MQKVYGLTLGEVVGWDFWLRRRRKKEAYCQYKSSEEVCIAMQWRIWNAYTWWSCWHRLFIWEVKHNKEKRSSEEVFTIAMQWKTEKAYTWWRCWRGLFSIGGRKRNISICVSKGLSTYKVWAYTWRSCWRGLWRTKRKVEFWNPESKDMGVLHTYCWRTSRPSWGTSAWCIRWLSLCEYYTEMEKRWVNNFACSCVCSIGTKSTIKWDQQFRELTAREGDLEGESDGYRYDKEKNVSECVPE